MYDIMIMNINIIIYKHNIIYYIIHILFFQWWQSSTTWLQQQWPLPVPFNWAESYLCRMIHKQLDQLRPEDEIWLNSRLKSVIKWSFPDMGVPLNHPFRLGFSIVNHPFGGTVYGNPHILFTSNLRGMVCTPIPTSEEYRIWGNYHQL